MSLLRRPLLFLLVLLIIAAVVGLLAIGFIGLPAPTTRIEKAIPSDRLAR